MTFCTVQSSIYLGIAFMMPTDVFEMGMAPCYLETTATILQRLYGSICVEDFIEAMFYCLHAPANDV